MATVTENRDAMNLAFATHMKNKNPGVDTQTTTNIEDFALAFSTSIADAIGAGVSGGVAGNFIEKVGGANGVMSGKFTALAGFEAGFDSGKQIETTVDGLKLIGDVNLSNGKFSIDGSEAIRNDGGGDLVIGGGFDNLLIDIPSIKVADSFVVHSAVSGLNVSDSIFQYKQGNIYYTGNANRSDVSWNMYNAIVSAEMSVAGLATFSGSLVSLHGFEAGVSNSKKFSAIADGLEVFGDIFLPAGGKIKSRYNDDYFISDHDNGNVSLSATGGALHLGYNNTTKNILAASLYNYNGSRLLLDRFGVASFDWGFSGGTDGINRFEATDNGLQINERLDFENDQLQVSRSAAGLLTVKTPSGYVSIGSQDSTWARFETDRPKVYFNKPLSVTEYNVHGAETRLEANKLLLSNDNYLVSTADGIKHYGHSRIIGSIGTSSFSSGFAGTGWQIDPDASATFTNLTVRTKLKVYEFEVQKITAVNGSFWVSANCSGETATKL